MLFILCNEITFNGIALNELVLNKNKISPNNEILFNGVLIPRLLNNPFAYCSLINFDFLLPHMAHFDNIIVLPLVVFETFEFMVSVFFLHFKQ